ncbi:MAG TPA: ATP-binding protein [Candidatus Saccharimonadales bacterium]|nr:ATP-binding protein [Candidatus Saccharimonadales bacterium]
MINSTLVALLVVCLAHLLLGLTVLIKNHKDPTNRVFGAFVVSLVLWLLSNYFSNVQTFSPNQILFFNYATLAFPGLALYFLLIFSLHFTGLYKPIPALWRYLLGALALICSGLSATPWVVSGLVRRNDINEIVFGPLSAIYFVYILVYFLATLVALIGSYRKLRGAAKARLQYVLLSLFLAFVVSIATNLILPILTNDFSYVVYGPFSTVLMIAGFSYAIIKHRLFDIRLVVARSVAYILLLTTLAGLYGVAIFGATQLLFPQNTTTTAQNTVNIILAIILAFTFQPLRRFFEHATDQIFFRDRYDSQAVLSRVGKILASELLLQKLLDGSLREICHSLHVERGQFIIFEAKKIYQVGHYGPLPDKLIVAPELAKLNRLMLVADELPAGRRKDILDDHRIRLSLVLRTKKEFVGFLLLGDKLSGDIYSNQDLKLLGILAPELSVAIVNAKAYAKITQFNLTLQQRVQSATASLRTANRNLKALDRTKDEFISMASHQLRTPLTTIKGYLSMIAEGDAGATTPQQREFLEYAMGGAERMVGLISDLLNVSRLSAGRFLIEKRPVDLVELVADEVRQLQSHAAAKALQLQFSRPPRPVPPVELDEGKTRQVIMNFIDNAIYYTRAGGVYVSLEVDRDQVRLKVKDTGIGVPQAARHKLFTKFFRADNAQAARPDGTGLGLYLAKRVVEDQGGSIIFDSVEGQGSTFGFEMPLGRPQPSLSPAPHPPGGPRQVKLAAKR